MASTKGMHSWGGGGWGEGVGWVGGPNKTGKVEGGGGLGP